MSLHGAVAQQVRRERLRACFPGERVIRTERARWGFATPTRILTLASGSRVVIQLVPNAMAERAPHGSRLFRDAGLPAPRLIANLPRPGSACLVWAFVQGEIGAGLIDGPNASSLAKQLGVVQRGIQAIRGLDVPRDEAWSTPGELRAAAGHWLTAVGAQDWTGSVTAILDRIVDRGWVPAVSHGDFVPANVLVADRRISAILDLGDVALRHPLVDAAWWSLIVAYHHGTHHARLEAAFLEGAGLLATDDQRRQLADVAAIRALQLAAARRGMRTGPGSLLAVAMGRAEWRTPGK